jgi:hypothetical protein
MKIASHFDLIEFVRSQTATRHGLDNTPTDSAGLNLIRLAATLERVRTAIGNRPLQITSGYRSPELNARIGGSRASAHMDGRAADIVVRNLSPLQVCRAIQAAGIVLDQLIFEGDWTHVGIARVGETPRGDVLTAVFKPGHAVRYQRGIVAAGA